MLLLLLLLPASAQAQVIDVASVQFDLEGCVNPTKAYNCWQQAHTDYNAVSCSTTQCKFDASIAYAQLSIGCITESCWNRALTCEYQYALSSYIQQYILDVDTDFNLPFFSQLEYTYLPGACVCNIPLVTDQLFTDPPMQCEISHLDYRNTSCQCCVWGERLAFIHDLCPHNDLRPFGVNKLVDRAKANSSHCQIWQSSDWHNQAFSTCEKLGAPPLNVTGWLNPLSLPSDFLATAPVSNLPGSVTALAQYKTISSTVPWVWFDGGHTTTYTFDAYNGTAASTTAEISAAFTSVSASYSVWITGSHTGTVLSSATAAAKSNLASTTSSSGAARTAMPAMAGIAGLACLGIL